MNSQTNTIPAAGTGAAPMLPRDALNGRGSKCHVRHKHGDIAQGVQGFKEALHTRKSIEHNLRQ
jgi:hypothetical protein